MGNSPSFSPALPSHDEPRSRGTAFDPVVSRASGRQSSPQSDAGDSRVDRISAPALRRTVAKTKPKA